MPLIYLDKTSHHQQRRRERRGIKNKNRPQMLKIKNAKFKKEALFVTSPAPLTENIS